MNAWLEIGLSNALVATVLAVVVWCLTRIVRRPKFAFVLWTLVLVKLLVPGPRLEWATWRVAMPQPPSAGIAPDLARDEHARPAFVVEVVPLDVARTEAAPVEDSPVETAPVGARAAGTVPSGNVAHKSLPPRGKMPPGRGQQAARADATATIRYSPAVVLGVVWLSGSVLLLALAAQRLVRFRRLLARASRADATLVAEVAAMCETLGLARPPAVRVTSAQVPPLVWSALGRTTLLLPKALVERLDNDERATLIAHELAHLARRDPYVRWLELAAVSVYWWHPVAWWARRNVARAGELCCDALVVDWMPERAHAYARTLLAAVEYCTSAQAALPAGSSGFSQAGTLKRRFEMILAARRSRHLGWPLRLAVAALAAIALPASFHAVAADPAGEKTAAGSKASTAADVSVEKRLDRLEKMIEALTQEVQTLKATAIANADPAVVKTVPATGAEDVDPDLQEIRVTFNKEMLDGSWSWTQRSDESFPEVTGKIHYLEDKRTCVLPVKLEPGKTYYLSINSRRFQNFKDTQYRPAMPYPLVFTTKK